MRHLKKIFKKEKNRFLSKIVSSRDDDFNLFIKKRATNTLNSNQICFSFQTLPSSLCSLLPPAAAP
jgi:hypothetical protein